MPSLEKIEYVPLTSYDYGSVEYPHARLPTDGQIRLYPD